jgi:hypothetical protein
MIVMNMDSNIKGQRGAGHLAHYRNPARLLVIRGVDLISDALPVWAAVVRRAKRSHQYNRLTQSFSAAHTML